MTNSNETRKNFIKYISLSVLGMLAFSGFIIIDTFFISVALGANGLTALNISIVVFSIVHGVSLMIGIGGATRFTIVFESDGNNKIKASKIFVHSLFLAGVFSVVFVFSGIFFSDKIAGFLGADYIILPLAVPYIKTILIFSPAFFVNNILIAFVRNDKNPKLAMASMTVASLVNIVLDYIFLFSLDMGMFGAAIATVFSVLVGILILCSHFFMKICSISFYRCKIQIKKLLDIISLGASAFVGEFAFTVSLITFNLVILSIEGNVGVAAFGIVANITIVPLNIINGVALGVQPLISLSHAAKNKVEQRSLLKYSLSVVITLAVLVFIFANIFNRQIIDVFNSGGNETLQTLTQMGFRIYFIGLIFAGINMIAAAFFSASEDAKTAVLISTLRSSIVLIPSLFILSFLFSMNGVWFSFVFAEFIVAIAAILFLRKKVKF